MDDDDEWMKNESMLMMINYSFKLRRSSDPVCLQLWRFQEGSTSDVFVYFFCEIIHSMELEHLRK